MMQLTPLAADGIVKRCREALYDLEVNPVVTAYGKRIGTASKVEVAERIMQIVAEETN